MVNIEELIGLRQDLDDDVTDRKLLGDLLHPMDEKEHFANGIDYYVWHYVIGKHFRPKKIGEIGTRFGYSLKCLADGSGWDKDVLELWSYDCDSINNNCNKIASEYFKDYKFTQHNVDTQLCSNLAVNDLDMFHVDGEHTIKGVYHDCVLALNALKTGGILLVDDCKSQLVMTGLLALKENYGLDYKIIRNYTDIALIVNDGRWKDKISCNFMDHEVVQKKFISNFISKDMVVYDIGAGHGEYSLLFSKLGAFTIAFEPSPRECETLAMRKLPNFTLEKKAVWSVGGEMQFWIYNNLELYGSNSIKKCDVNFMDKLMSHLDRRQVLIDGNLCGLWEFEHGVKKYDIYKRKAEDVEQIKVPCISLNEYIVENPPERLDFIRIDVNGAEMEVLRSAVYLLKYYPTFMFRSSPDKLAVFGYSPNDIFSFFNHKGYNCFKIMPNSNLNPNFTSKEGDFIAMPKDVKAKPFPVKSKSREILFT